MSLIRPCNRPYHGPHSRCSYVPNSLPRTLGCHTGGLDPLRRQDWVLRAMRNAIAVSIAVAAVKRSSRCDVVARLLILHPHPNGPCLRVAHPVCHRLTSSSWSQYLSGRSDIARKKSGNTVLCSPSHQHPRREEYVASFHPHMRQTLPPGFSAHGDASRQ